MIRIIAKLSNRNLTFASARRTFASSKGTKDIYVDDEEECKKAEPKKIGNLIVEDEVYRCKAKEKAAVEEDKRQDCWAGRKALSEKKHSPVTHVIFNLDGVVLDSEKLIHEAHSMYLNRFRKGFPNKLKIRTSGLSELDAGKLLIYELNLQEVLPGITDAIYAQGMRQYFRGMLHRIRLMPDANNLICHLYKSGIPIALASSSTESMFKLKTRCFQKLIDRFCHITLRTDSEVKIGKPDPDMYFVSMRKFHNAPQDRSQYLAIEDSIAGARAAKAAGMQVVLLPSRPIPYQMAYDESDMVVEKLSDIDLTDFALPMYPQGMQYT